MATAGRIDEIIKNEDGTYFVKFTQGEFPLPATWGGEGKPFGDEQSMVDWMREQTEAIDGEKLAALAFSGQYKKDPTFKTLTAFKGKQAVVDADGLQQPITLL